MAGPAVSGPSRPKPLGAPTPAGIIMPPARHRDGHQRRQELDACATQYGLRWHMPPLPYVSSGIRGSIGGTCRPPNNARTPGHMKETKMEGGTRTSRDMSEIFIVLGWWDHEEGKRHLREHFDA